jgi:hypothetical protein
MNNSPSVAFSVVGVTTGNTHAPCVIIGERLAEILNA